MKMTQINTAILNKRDLHLNGLVIPSIEYGDPRVLAKEPFVSVCMITYNHEAYISQAIEHVARQETSFPIELIIGEDCSTDRTREIVFEYQREYPDLIRVITSENNVGMRKNGLRTYEAARGKYIAFCEGDDYWHDPRKLQIQVDFLESNPNYGLVCSDARSYTVETGTLLENAISRRPHLCRTDDPYLKFLTGAIHIWPLTVCMRTDLLREIHRECPECSDSSYLMGDTQRYLEIAHRTKIKVLPDVLATRNLLPESATRSRDVRKLARVAASQKRLIHHYLAKYPVPPDIDKQTRRWIALRGLYFAYVCRDWHKAVEEMSDLRALNLAVPTKYKLYYLGSWNVVTFGVVHIGLNLLEVCCALRRSIIAACRRLIASFSGNSFDRSSNQTQR